MSIKLLLADDSITIHKVVGLTFADEDVQIEAVANGNLAIEKARSGNPDIVLADVFMPGRNGYEVCDSIKSDPEIANTPVVLLVGTFEPFDEEEAARVRCDAHLTKPFDTSELIQLVYHLVGHRESHALKTPELQVDERAGASTTAGSNGVQARTADLISPRTRESFLGDRHILDIFDFSASPPEAPQEPANLPCQGGSESVAEQDPTQARPVIPFPGSTKSADGAQPTIPLSAEAIDQIVERVVRRMSESVVRDIAWEVVPALSEIMIRQYLDELRTGNKS